jgi:hypothetical protein
MRLKERKGDDNLSLSSNKFFYRYSSQNQVHISNKIQGKLSEKNYL